MTFSQLFHRVYPALVRFLHRRLGDRDLAEDLAQESFVRLLAKDPEQPEPWLYKVATNLARDVNRGQVRRARHLLVLASDTEAEQEDLPGADGEVVAQETSGEVRAALEKLSDRDRDLLLLHQDGMSYRELAEIIGVNPNSVAPLLARARQRFLKQYQHAPEGDRVAASS
jgi:RNA polymerase sigma-70 factor (ECF subfamily)